MNLMLTYINENYDIKAGHNPYQGKEAEKRSNRSLIRLCTAKIIALKIIVNQSEQIYNRQVSIFKV